MPQNAPESPLLPTTVQPMGDPAIVNTIPPKKGPVPAQFVGKNWKPGQSGNPYGRPPTAPSKVKFTEVCKAMLASKQISIEYTFPDNKKNVLLTKTFKIASNKTIYHSVVAALIREALGGNIQAIKELIDRCESEPDQAGTEGLKITMKREIIDRRHQPKGNIPEYDDQLKVEDRTEATPMDTNIGGSTTIEPDLVTGSAEDVLAEALKADQNNFLASENAENATLGQNSADQAPIDQNSDGEALKGDQNNVFPFKTPKNANIDQNTIEDADIDDILESC